MVSSVYLSVGGTYSVSSQKFWEALGLGGGSPGAWDVLGLGGEALGLGVGSCGAGDTLWVGRGNLLGWEGGAVGLNPLDWEWSSGVDGFSGVEKGKPWRLGWGSFRVGRRKC